MEEVKTPKQMAEEYCHEVPISCFDRLFVSLEEIRIGAFKSGYQAAELKAKMEFAAKYDHNSPLQIIAAEYVKRRGTIGPLALLEENRFIDGYEAGMNSSKKLDSWISVKDRLPSNGDLVVIVCSNEATPSIAFALFEFWDNWKVTHWMPLPNPPEE